MIPTYLRHVWQDSVHALLTALAQQCLMHPSCNGPTYIGSLGPKVLQLPFKQVAQGCAGDTRLRRSASGLTETFTSNDTRRSELVIPPPAISILNLLPLVPHFNT